MVADLVYARSMSTLSAIHTADQLAAATGLGRCELIRGQLIMMSPAGFQHGRIAATIAHLLMDHVQCHGLGVVTGAETGFLLEQNPDTVRAPDVAFVERSRLPVSEPTGFFPGAPSLAVEVGSPHDSRAALHVKASDWRQYGCGEVWLGEPADRTLPILGVAETRRFGSSEQIESRLLPGLRFVVDSVF